MNARATLGGLVAVAAAALLLLTGCGTASHPASHAQPTATQILQGDAYPLYNNSVRVRGRGEAAT